VCADQRAPNNNTRDTGGVGAYSNAHARAADAHPKLDAHGFDDACATHRNTDAYLDAHALYQTHGGGAVGELILKEGAARPLSGVASALSAADLLIAGLKSPISELGQPEPKRFTYRAPLAALETLTLAGVDVVSVANNHANDYGWEALADTRERLLQQHIQVVGFGADATAARTPVVIKQNGLRVAILAYLDVPPEARSGFDARRWVATDTTAGLVWAQPEVIAADVLAAKAQAEVVIVLLHFGLETGERILAAQRQSAYAAVENGASLVLGTYPDRLQGYEHYNEGKLIVYSLGKFIYEGFASPDNDSVILTATLTAQGVADFDWIPVVLQDGLPSIATGADAQRILTKIEN